MEKDRLKLIEEMLATNPDDSFLHYAAALEYHKFGQVEVAIQKVEALLKADKNYLGAYYKLGKMYEETGKIDQAISTYKLGKGIAREQSDLKTVGELTEALMLLDADEDETDW